MRDVDDQLRLHGAPHCRAVCQDDVERRARCSSVTNAYVRTIARKRDVQCGERLIRELRGARLHAISIDALRQRQHVEPGIGALQVGDRSVDDDHCEIFVVDTRFAEPTLVSGCVDSVDLRKKLETAVYDWRDVRVAPSLGLTGREALFDEMRKRGFTRRPDSPSSQAVVLYAHRSAR